MVTYDVPIKISAIQDVFLTQGEHSARIDIHFYASHILRKQPSKNEAVLPNPTSK